MRCALQARDVCLVSNACSDTRHARHIRKDDIESRMSNKPERYGMSQQPRSSPSQTPRSDRAEEYNICTSHVANGG